MHTSVVNKAANINIAPAYKANVKGWQARLNLNNSEPWQFKVLFNEHMPSSIK